VATLIAIDILECKHLLSVVGTAGNIVEVDRSQPVAVSAPPAPGDAVSLGTSDASSALPLDGAMSQATPPQPAASEASTTSSEEDTSPKDAGEAIAPTLAVPGQQRSSAIALDVGGGGLPDSSVPTSGDGGPTLSATDPPAAAPDVPGGGLRSSSDPTSVDQGPIRSAAEHPTGEHPGDLGWTIDAGVAPSEGTEEASSVSPATAPAASVPVRSGPLVNGGAVARLSGHALSASEPGPDGAPLREAAADPLIAASAPGRLTAGPDVTVDGTRSRGDGEIFEVRAGEGPLPASRCADLLTEFLPFDRATLDHAIDSFLDPLEDLGSECANWSPSRSLIPTATLVVTTALTAEVVRRRVRSGQWAAEEGDEDVARIPDYAPDWGLGES
jgi:hypothetical protein